MRGRRREGVQRKTHGNVDDELLVDVAEEIRVCLVELFRAEDGADVVLLVFVETVELLAVEGLEQRGLATDAIDPRVQRR